MKISFRRSEKDIIASIREGNQRVMEEVYFSYRNEFVSWSRRKFAITEQDALDHYQDTLTVFFEKVMNNSISGIESSLKTYLFGIGKNKVRQQFDERNRMKRHEEGLVEHYRFLSENKEAEATYDLARQQTWELFDAMGEACKHILRLFYFEKRSMSEIAEIMGHNSEAVSRTTKKRCLEKIRSQVKKPLGDG
ncbi:MULTISPECIES: RNA polymerase sigma factor [unclassified Imperialibacter]|uniref:RNA polymerase sigma factor n=1 Tax=unclassified Imperialibacter TaxID=2629706 RepID=UPI0012512B5F|nr:MULTISPECIES: sigma-70 family RNA polymerase sigma factor [unclassified Imperialibacter]CAD5253532.1 putative RNA polymerase sigma factor, sigma-70 family [Imperialibacter sp. 89]CAD5284754.1 putative RNA polymerase sigma factor, sigma-70 family [Imperialibacter sp. 75]VVT31665.1 putative RNA polymerase sigma factor, sigma-70 family [Imperialibacter sp. EC-SDR9]